MLFFCGESAWLNHQQTVLETVHHLIHNRKWLGWAYAVAVYLWLLDFPSTGKTVVPSPGLLPWLPLPVSSTLASASLSPSLVRSSVSPLSRFLSLPLFRSFVRPLSRPLSLFFLAFRFSWWWPMARVWPSIAEPVPGAQSWLMAAVHATWINYSVWVRVWVWVYICVCVCVCVCVCLQSWPTRTVLNRNVVSW